MAVSKSDRDLLNEAKENFKIATEWWDDNRKAWLEDAKFRAGEQWPSKIKKDRETEGKPCLVVDKLNQYVKQVVNDSRQNRPTIKVRPVDDKADIETAEGFQGLIRSILNRSRADEAFDTAIDHAASCGFGYIRVITDYAHEHTFNQEIGVKRVRNPCAVLLGPHEEADGSDAQFGFVITDEPKARFKSKYPKAKSTNWQDSSYSDGWSDEHSVKVCEYFYKIEVPQTLLLLKDGTSATQEDYARSAEEGGEVSPVKDSREIPLCKVKWCRLTGAELLEKNDWLGKYIPIVPVYGDESDIEGKVRYSGMIRLGRDPQILHNFSRSMFAQRVSMTPMAPWLAGAEQIAGFDEWDSPALHAVLRYKMYDEAGNQLPPPQRINPSDVPAGFAQDAQISEHDIQGALGMYNSSLGEKSNEKSGKAIMARQREGDTATFHYQDNLNRAIRHLGRILVDLGPKIYDSTRLIRMLGEDGDTSEARIDPRQQVAHQKTTENGSELSVYNLGVGVYDVDIDSGPSYTTKRAESADAMIELTRANPSMWQTHGDLIVGAQDWPNAQEFAKRSKLLLPPQVQQDEDGQDPDVQRVVAQAKQALAQKDEQIQAAEERIQQDGKAIESLQTQILALRRSVVVKGAEVEVKGQQAETGQYDAETRRLAALAPALPMDAAGLAAVVQQLVADALATHLGGLPPTKPPDAPVMAPMAEPPPGGFFTPGGSQ